jgi:hypothetical protein
MSKTLAVRLLLEALQRYIASEIQLGEALKATRVSFREAYFKTFCPDPNGGGCLDETSPAAPTPRITDAMIDEYLRKQSLRRKRRRTKSSPSSTQEPCEELTSQSAIATRPSGRVRSGRVSSSEDSSKVPRPDGPPSRKRS